MVTVFQSEQTTQPSGQRTNGAMMSRQIEADSPSCSANRLRTAPIQPILIPLWYGAERLGPDLAPALLADGLARRWDRPDRASLADRLGRSLPISIPELTDDGGDPRARATAYAEAIRSVTAAMAPVVAETIDRGDLALALGGDHALAAGSLAGARLAASRAGGRVGVLWFDTHGDLNTPETSLSGHIHGMPLAMALGHDTTILGDRFGTDWLDAADVCLLGVRDLDPSEREFIAERGIRMLTMEEWHDLGLAAGLDAAVTYLQRRAVSAVHVSFDLDVLDPTVMPGTGTRISGGLNVREAAALLRQLRGVDLPVRSLDWVELNPLLDPSGNSTEVAVSLLATTLGETMR